MELIKRDKVSSFMTDASVNLSVIGIFQIAEDAVTEFMGDLKLDGITAKRKYNAVWVYVKTRIKIWKNIPWNHEYSATCFISKTTPISMYLDVEIKDGSGALCAYSRSELCPLDLQSGRIRKLSTVGIDENIPLEAPAIDISFAKFKAKDLPQVDQVRIGYISIDYAGHTNNKEYLRFILNTYSVRELTENPIRELEIIYSNQSYEDDILTIHKGSLGGKDIFAIHKENVEIVKCEILR